MVRLIRFQARLGYAIDERTRAHYENAREAAIVEGLEVFGVGNLREAHELISGEYALAPTRVNLAQLFAQHQRYDTDFSEVKGNQHVKRAIEVAVAGGHNLLKMGSF